MDCRSWTRPAAGIGILALSATNPLAINPLHVSITSLLHTYGTILPTRLTRPRFRIDNWFLSPRPRLLAVVKPLQPQSQSPLIPRTPLLSKPAIRSPTPLSGCLNPDQITVAPLIRSRIETHVYLDIHLPSRSWNAIQLPLTKLVTSDGSSSIREGIKPLLLVINAHGATTRQECNRVCEQCEKRMGNKTGAPSLIDFHGPSNILTPKNEIVQVHLTFSCYSRHHPRNLCTSSSCSYNVLIAY